MRNAMNNKPSFQDSHLLALTAACLAMAAFGCRKTDSLGSVREGGADGVGKDGNGCQSTGANPSKCDAPPAPDASPDTAADGSACGAAVQESRSTAPRPVVVRTLFPFAERIAKTHAQRSSPTAPATAKPPSTVRVVPAPRRSSTWALASPWPTLHQTRAASTRWTPMSMPPGIPSGGGAFTGRARTWPQPARRGAPTRG